MFLQGEEFSIDLHRRAPAAIDENRVDIDADRARSKYRLQVGSGRDAALDRDAAAREAGGTSDIGERPLGDRTAMQGALADAEPPRRDRLAASGRLRAPD